MGRALPNGISALAKKFQRNPCPFHQVRIKVRKHQLATRKKVPLENVIAASALILGFQPSEL